MKGTGRRDNMLKINELARLYLGVKKENEARTINIDMSAWAQIYPDATVDILHQRQGDQTKYLTGATYDSETKILSWTPTEYDTFYEGFGIAEIRMVEGNVVKKTKDLLVTAVSPSLIDGTGAVIESDYQAWLDEVLSYKNAAVTAKNAAEGYAEEAEHLIDVTDVAGAEAETLAPGSDATAEIVTTAEGKKFLFGIPMGNPGEAGVFGIEMNGQAVEIDEHGVADLGSVVTDQSGKVDKQQAVADAGKALGINSQGMVEPVPFSGDDFTGATASTPGVHGYVPAPAAGDQGKALYGDGTWKNIPAPTDMTGATASEAGTHGLVPAPAAGDQGKALFGDGTWKQVADPSDMTGATASANGTHGLVPAPLIADRAKFLCGDGNWTMPEGGKLVVFELDTVTNTSGSYSHTTTLADCTHDMKAVAIEVSNAAAFGAEITVTTADGSITLACDSVSGSSDVTVSCLFVANPSEITSSEFDVLSNRIGTLSSLTTTNKTDLVSAVNEVNGNLSGLRLIKITKTVTVPASGSVDVDFSSSVPAGTTVFAISNIRLGNYVLPYISGSSFTWAEQINPSTKKLTIKNTATVWTNYELTFVLFVA